jgi:hypothetical protein
MLYNPQWRKRNVHDLIAWLETRDPAETYNFHNCGDCLIERWMGNHDRMGWPPEIMAIYAGRDPGAIARGRGSSFCVTDWTFGAALARARAAVAAEAVAVA